MKLFRWILVLLVAALPYAACAQTQTFVDPNEGAFSMQFPAGWRVTGGEERFAAWQSWMTVTGIAPDGSALVRMESPYAIIFFKPTLQSARLGLYEGRPYTPDGMRAMYLHVLTPLEFMRMVVAQDPRYRGLQVTGSHVGVGGGTAIDLAYPAVGMTGVAKVSINDEGSQWRATILMALWRPGAASRAVSAAKLAVTSLQGNAQWAARNRQRIQEDTNAAISGANYRMGIQNNIYREQQQTSAMITNGYYRREAVGDQTQRKWDQTLRGVTTVQNTQTGERYEIKNTGNQHWLVNGRVVDSNSPIAPSKDAVKLNGVDQ
ncbi:MAG: hypothetical protein ACYCW6_13855 [Candidatus Xenobia bacterium]